MPLGYRDVLNILSALEMMKIHKCVENFCSDYSLGNQLNPERKFPVTVRSSALLCLIILYVVELRAGGGGQGGGDGGVCTTSNSPAED